MRLDPRMPVDPRYGEQGRRAPRLVTAECPRCGYRFGTKFELCAAICRCGWFLKIEPMPSYGHVDQKFLVSVDDMMRVEDDGWEQRGDPPDKARRLEAVRRFKEYIRRKKDSGEWKRMLEFFSREEMIELGV